MKIERTLTVYTSKTIVQFVSTGEHDQLPRPIKIGDMLVVEGLDSQSTYLTNVYLNYEKFPVDRLVLTINANYPHIKHYVLTFTQEI